MSEARRARDVVKSFQLATFSARSFGATEALPIFIKRKEARGSLRAVMRTVHQVTVFEPTSLCQQVPPEYQKEVGEGLIEEQVKHFPQNPLAVDESMSDGKLLWGNTPSACRGQLQPSELLAEGEDLLINKNIQSVADKSKARACAATGSSDPGPTVSEPMRNQDPLEYALSVLRKEYHEDELDTYDLSAIEPFLPHSALRERQLTIA
ncbi:hypothetical protein V865_001152 [Kwoniella europaea PYCC6329]|uniref:Uncharacterized protein n=1 Tax=Kwoniella europaea PYCC6329 TaxID=1423913 RepID=A0AAX4KBW2_9TREE